ncbi:MAG TPA: ATP-binding protein [Pseudonocardiaceae bacterium]|nr:ATP-binding protein [Pseudonocardiaceae bacterium]
MPDLHGFSYHELTSVPRSVSERDTERQRADDRTAPLAASLTGSHADLLATGAPDVALLAAWIRPPQGSRLHVLLGGRPYFPPASSGSMLFPPGATAMELSTRDADNLLSPFRHWVPCTARPDALWAPKDSAPVRRGSFDRHVAHLRGAFAWLVIAEPLSPKALEPELRTLVNEILPLSRGEVGEAKRIELERKQARHRELSRAQLGGGWRIRVLVGSVDERGAGATAAMLCAATELDGLPYVLQPGEGAFTSGTELLVALTRPPERELPGLRLVEPHSFDVTPDRAEPDGVRLGAVLDEGRVEVGDLMLSHDTLNRHTFVCGATGGGKSQTVRHLLAQASRAGLPWLVVEPAKAEYTRMAGRIAEYGQDVIVIRPGDPDGVPAGLNPLAPTPGFPLQPHVDVLRALFLAAFEAQEPFPQILAAALTRCYEELGWDLTLGEPVNPGQRPRYPTLGDLQRAAAVVVGEIGYSKEISDNVQGFIRVRLGSLRLGTAGRFFDGGHPLDFDLLRRRNVVLEIEDVSDDADKAFIMGAVLMRLSEHLRVTARRPGGLTHLTVIEEAHRLLRRPELGVAGPAAHAVEMFAAMLAEVRAYGEGLIIAEQIPAKLTMDVIKNTAVKIVHRLPAKDDRDSVGATMNVDDAQSRYLVTLPPGEGAVFADGMDRPLLVRVPDGTDAESSPGKLASVVDVIGRRSATCGRECVAMPCTLRQVRAAARTLADERWLVVWAELAVLAHLTGQPVPVPTADVRAAFTDQGLPTRLVDCALSHAVDDAVAVRSAVLGPTTDPAALAAHVCADLAGSSPECDLRYLARPFRWERVRRALATGQLDMGMDDGRHPLTTQWEREFRRKIPGDTRPAQLATVQEWLLSDLRDTALVDAVTYGTRRPSTLESVMNGTEALAQFVDCTWPLLHLTDKAQP